MQVVAVAEAMVVALRALVEQVVVVLVDQLAAVLLELPIQAVVGVAQMVAPQVALVVQAVELNKVAFQAQQELQIRDLKAAMALVLGVLAEAVAVAVQEQLGIMAHPLLVVPVVLAWRVRLPDHL